MLQWLFITSLALSGPSLSRTVEEQARVDRLCGGAPTQEDESGICHASYVGCANAAVLNESPTHHTIVSWQSLISECRPEATPIEKKAVPSTSQSLSRACGSIKDNLFRKVDAYNAGSCTLRFQDTSTAIYWRGESLEVAHKKFDACYAIQNELVDDKTGLVQQIRKNNCNPDTMRATCIDMPNTDPVECMNRYIGKRDPNLYVRELLCHRMNLRKSVDSKECLALLANCGISHNRRGIAIQNPSGETALCEKVKATVDVLETCKASVDIWWRDNTNDKYEVTLKNPNGPLCVLNFDGKLSPPEGAETESSAAHTEVK